MEGEKDMDVASAVGIIVALIGVLGAAVIDIIKSKKQGDEIKGGVSDIKTDTSAMKPKIDNIDENTKKVRDAVVEKLVPQVKDIAKMSDKIDCVHEDVKYRRRLKDEFSLGLTDKDYFTAGIEKLYERNGFLESENKQLKRKVYEQEEVNIKLQKENDDLRSRNDKLSQKLKSMERAKDKEREREF